MWVDIFMLPSYRMLKVICCHPRSIRAFQDLHEDHPILEQMSCDDSSDDEANGQEDMIGPYNVYSTYFDD